MNYYGWASVFFLSASAFTIVVSIVADRVFWTLWFDKKCFYLSVFLFITGLILALIGTIHEFTAVT